MRGVLFLASSSPRRRALLREAGIGFRLHPPGAEPVGRGDPLERVVQRACAKAEGAPPPVEPGLVLGVDTVVVLDGSDDGGGSDGRVELGKPADRAAAEAMLRRLSGREHEVATAHCLHDPASGRSAAAVALSRVRCAALPDSDLAAYLDSEDWADKAGAYGIQSGAGAFMELVDGELDTVIGLNVASVRRLMEGFE